MTTITNTDNKIDNDIKIICKGTFSDSFLLYLIKESSTAQNVKPYEHQYLQNNKKFELTKHLTVEVYLGLHRLVNRHKITKWRKYANDISKYERHEGYRNILSKLIYEIIIDLCDINININNNNIDINSVYDDINNIHNKSKSFNTKTRISYLKEKYIFGAKNVNISSIKTKKEFEKFKEISKRTCFGNDNPFKLFKFSLNINLLLKQQRKNCVYCGKSAHIYCSYCKVPFALDYNNNNNNTNQIIPKFPNLRLPINVDIIRHPKEKVNVCSSVHGCVVSPNYVRMYEFPNIPNYINSDGVFLLYPSDKSIFLDEMDLLNINKIIVIESRWRGNKQIYEHPQLKKLKHCKIRNRQTLYWRYQEYSSEYLATIEALYYGVIDCHIAKYKQYNNEYDDLLLLYACDHAKIRNDINNKNRKLPRVWTDNQITNK